MMCQVSKVLNEPNDMEDRIAEVVGWPKHSKLAKNKSPHIREDTHIQLLQLDFTTSTLMTKG